MLVLKIWGFEKKGNRSKQRKTSLFKDQNKQQTQPMYATINFRTQTLTLFLGGTSALTQDLTMYHDWPVKNAIVDLQI